MRLATSEDKPPPSNKRALTLSHEDPIISALEQLDLPLDSQVTVSRPGYDVDKILLQDVYRIKSGLPLTITALRCWSPGQPFPFGPRRDNYGGIVLPTATVVSILASIRFLSYLTTLFQLNWL